MFSLRRSCGWILCFGVSAQLQAAPARSLNVGLGLTSYGMNSLSESSSGKVGTFGTSFYHLQIEYHQPIAASFMFSPRLNYMHESLYAVESPDKGSKTSFNFLSLPVVYNLNPMWDFSGGFTFSQYTVKGKGGSIVMNNGNSQTTFQKPGRTTTSNNFGWILGAAMNIAKVRGGLDLLIQSPLANDRRHYSLILSCTYSVYPMSSSPSY